MALSFTASKKPHSWGITWYYQQQYTFSSNPIWRVAAMLDLLITETSNQTNNVTIVFSMVEKLTFRHITQSFKSVYMALTHLHNSPQNWGFGPLYRIKLPPWGYFCTWYFGFHWNFATGWGWVVGWLVGLGLGVGGWGVGVGVVGVGVGVVGGVARDPSYLRD